MTFVAGVKAAYLATKRFIDNHGTKVIAFATGTISAIAGVSGIIPESHLKYYMAGIAVMTFWRGFINQSKQEKAQ